MRQAIVFVLAAAICMAGAAPAPAPAPQDPLNSPFLQQQQAAVRTPAILRQQSDINPDGSFTYSFDTENGISARAEATVSKTADPNESIQTVRGQYSYTGPDGVQYTVQYIANENGFQAFGDHLPTPPPIPEEIQRSLEYNAAHPEEDNSVVESSPQQPIRPQFNTANNIAVQPAAISLMGLVPLAKPVAATATSAVLPGLPTQQQQLVQAQLLAQPQILQQQQPQQQQQLQQLQLQQQFQSQPFQQQQFQPQQIQPQPFQPQFQAQQQFVPQNIPTQLVPNFQQFK